MLHSRGVKSLLIEGGASILQSCLEQNLVDQVVVTIRPCLLGGYNSLVRQLPRPLPLKKVVAASVGGDVVLHGIIDDEGDGERGPEESQVEEKVGESMRSTSDGALLRRDRVLFLK